MGGAFFGLNGLGATSPPASPDKRADRQVGARSCGAFPLQVLGKAPALGFASAGDAGRQVAQELTDNSVEFLRRLGRPHT